MAITMSTTSTAANINNLIINKVPNQDVFEAMRTNGDIQENQIYLVEGLYSLPGLTIGNKTYDGTTAIHIDVYDGSYTWTNS